MGFERIFVGKELCCHSAIQLFSSGRAKNYDRPPALRRDRLAGMLVSCLSCVFSLP
jgi:hypothetical protein